MAENILEIVLSKTLYYVLCHFAGVKVTCSVLGSRTCIGAVGKCVYFSAFFGSLVAGSEAASAEGFKTFHLHSKNRQNNRCEKA